MELKFKRERETKNTWRYNEVSEDGVEQIGSLYIQKWALKQAFGQAPEVITVTIQAQ